MLSIIMRLPANIANVILKEALNIISLFYQSRKIQKCGFEFHFKINRLRGLVLLTHPYARGSSGINQGFPKAVGTGLTLLLACGQAQAEDLWDIYQLALTNDATYQAAVLDHRAQELSVPLAESVFKPSVTASAQVGKNRTGIPSTMQTRQTRQTRDNHSANLNFNLPLYNRFDTAGIERAKSQVQASGLNLLLAKEDLMIRVASRYFDLLAAQDAKEVARVEKNVIKRQMDLAADRLEVGLGTRTDLFDARARLKLAEASEIRSQSAIDRAKARLGEITGLQPAVLESLKQDAPLAPPVPNDEASWIARSVPNNTTIQIARQNIQTALEEIDQQRTRNGPTISVDGNYRWVDGGSSNYTDTSVALQLRFPFYQGGAISLRSEQASIRYNQAEQLLEHARRTASADVTAAFLDVTNGVAQVKALFDAIAAGESALQAKEEGFNAGLTTNLDVLDAQRDLSISRTNYLRERYDYILAVLNLERAAGDLDEGDLLGINRWLE